MEGGDARRQALERVLELTVLLGEDMQRGLAAHGLTTARAHLLWELAERGPSTQQALAAALGVSPRNVTGLVDGLESTAHVRRRPHPGDRRATLVTLTEHGARVAGALREGRDQLAELLFADLPEATSTGLLVGLDAVLERLRRALAEGDGGPR